MSGWWIGAGQPYPSVTRFSCVKTFKRLFLIITPVLRWPVLNLSAKGVGAKYSSLEGRPVYMDVYIFHMEPRIYD
jgi:hypothetical protein